jgi:phospholipid/cholesterol/gamma-HCH transport system ATP-binding protein
VPGFSRAVMMNTPQTRTAVAESEAGENEPIIVFDHVSLAFDDTVVLRDVSFTLRRGHTKIILGASGAGKSISLKLILGLLKPDAGRIWVNGQQVDEFTEEQMMKVRADIGMVFQEGALFDSLTVAENVGYKLYEETDRPLDEVRRRVEEVLGFVRLSQFIDRRPSELSGGQRRRVAIARAMTVKPRILLYDEPTTGLDPITSTTIDEEIVKLRDLEEVTSILVTHQLRDAFFVATHEAVRRDGKVDFVPAGPAKLEEAEFMMLKDGLIIFEGTADELRSSKDEYIRAFLS